MGYNRRTYEQRAQKAESREQREKAIMDEIRLKKLEAIRKSGVCPYARHFEKSSHIKDLADNFQEGKETATAGRITALRAHGKSIFGDLKDISGKVQFYVKLNTVGEEPIISHTA